MFVFTNPLDKKMKMFPLNLESRNKKIKNNSKRNKERERRLLVFEPIKKSYFGVLSIMHIGGRWVFGVTELR